MSKIEKLARSLRRGCSEREREREEGGGTPKKRKQRGAKNYIIIFSYLFKLSDYQTFHFFCAEEERNSKAGTAHSVQLLLTADCRALVVAVAPRIRKVRTFADAASQAHVYTRCWLVPEIIAPIVVAGI